MIYLFFLQRIIFLISRYLEGTYHVSLVTDILPQINTIVKKCLLGLKEVRFLQINGMFSVMFKAGPFLFSALSFKAVTGSKMFRIMFT